MRNWLKAQTSAQLPADSSSQTSLLAVRHGARGGAGGSGGAGDAQTRDVTTRTRCEYAGAASACAPTRRFLESIAISISKYQGCTCAHLFQNRTAKYIVQLTVRGGAASLRGVVREKRITQGVQARGGGWAGRSDRGTHVAVLPAQAACLLHRRHLLDWTSGC